MSLPMPSRVPASRVRPAAARPTRGASRRPSPNGARWRASSARPRAHAPRETTRIPAASRVRSPRNGEHRHRPVLVPEFHRPLGIESRRRSERQPEVVADEYLTRVPRLADTPRRVPRVADHGVLEPAFAADISRERLAEVEPDADLECRTGVRRPTRVEPVEGEHHVARRVHRPVRVVALADRRAPLRHDGVADELVKCSDRKSTRLNSSHANISYA